jgi:MGT family glycosyltransferase
MKDFLLVTWDGGGNIPPELCLARKLIARGHRVRVLGDPTLEDEARAVGAAFSPWVTAPHRTTRDRSGDLIRDYAFRNPLAAMRRYLEDFLAAPSPRWIADIQAVLGQHPADVVVSDLAIPAALIAAEKLGLPTAVLVPSIWIVPTPGIPPMGGFMPARGPLGRLRDYAVRGIITRLFNKALPAFNRARAQQGLGPVPSAFAQMLRSGCVLVLTSPEFDFTSPHLPTTVRYAGPQLDDPTWSAPWRSPWPAHDARPLVLVGLSSTFQDQAATLRRIVEALSSLPVRALVTLGLTLRPDEVPGSDNVQVVPSAPHGQVLAQTSLLITHCGHGTTLKGLAAGVPLVCLPMGRDQDDTAARVVYRGAGVRLKPSAPGPTIRAAVERVLAIPSYRENAQRLAIALRKNQGCVDPIAELESLARLRRPSLAPTA